MAKLDYTKGIELLDGARSVAVCGHVNPDGDCLGSALALTLGLRSLGYEVTPLLATREQPQALRLSRKLRGLHARLRVSRAPGRLHSR